MRLGFAWRRAKRSRRHLMLYATARREAPVYLAQPRHRQLARDRRAPERHATYQTDVVRSYGNLPKVGDEARRSTGDYNGNACTPGINGIETPNVCTAWASPTPPKGVATEKKGIQVYAVCTPMTGAPVTVTYHQVGACNGYNGPYGLVEAGYKQAYVDFGIESIDNSLGKVAFDFDPKNLYVEPKLANHFDPGLQFYTDILGPKAATPLKVPAAVTISFRRSVQGATVVNLESRRSG